MSLVGDKDSPKTAQSQTSTTVTKTDNRAITGGTGSIGGNVDVSGTSGTGNTVNVSTTDQGAVAAGLQIALAGLDTANTAQSNIASTTHDAIQQAVGVAETVAQGQQNTTFKYVTNQFLESRPPQSYSDI